jgi:hypothetical protein
MRHDLANPSLLHPIRQTREAVAQTVKTHGFVSTHAVFLVNQDRWIANRLIEAELEVLRKCLPGLLSFAGVDGDEDGDGLDGDGDDDIDVCLICLSNG